ncbi:hypothetical protein [Silvimonas iriomotensis]|uniref:Uncharacterized protein n=1 Tax=Silvimonas iriomotensis TaxID=449662 RepID=A0ABQ2PBC8_9NEIS|nr:hypothetical protein [Silvimonas iriomotensis]GGP22683.1 hypothetical protein GCM10010970_26830 [Silvimonas iriomotensis]
MELKLQDGLYRGVLALLAGVFFLSFAFWLMVVCRIDMPLVLAALGTCAIGFAVWALGWLSAADTFPFLLAALSIVCSALMPVFCVLLQRHGHPGQPWPDETIHWQLMLLIPVLGMALRDLWLAYQRRAPAPATRPRYGTAAGAGWSMSL